MRGLTDVNGLRDIRGMRSAGRLSILQGQGRVHLDLYMLRTEEERLEREAALVARRSRAISKRLEEIQERVRALGPPPEPGRASGDGHRAAEPGGEGKGRRPWKTFALRY